MQKKKIKKYQFGNNPCGEGTVWDEVKKQCVPVIEKNITQQDLLWGNLISSNGTPTINETLYPVYTSGGVSPSALKSAGTDATGEVIKSDVVYPKGVGVKDGRGRFIPQNMVIGEALDQGFNLDSDNVYRKKEITEDKNKLWYSPTFQALNAAMDITRLIANPINNAKNSKEEREKLLKARYMRSKYNLDENGLNNVPVYMQTGGYVNNTGYTPGTDTFNNPFNIIPSNNITMENTPFPVIGYPNNGVPKVMKPGNRYTFPEASSVLEIPLLQNGGLRKPIFTNNPNDPRIRAYQDSLNLYNDVEKEYQDIKRSGIGLPGTKDEMKVKLSSEKLLPYNQFTNDYENGKKKFRHYNNGTNEYMDPQNISRFRGTGVLGFFDYFNQARFKKPEQPVIYQPSPINNISNVNKPIKKPVQPVVYKKEEKLLKRNTTPQALIKANREDLKIIPNSLNIPLNTEIPNLPYQVDYFDPVLKQRTSKYFPSDVEGAEFLKDLDPATGLPEYRNRGDNYVRAYYNKFQDGGLASHTKWLNSPMAAAMNQGEEDFTQRRLSDDEIINLMNSVSFNDRKYTPVAQYGDQFAGEEQSIAKIPDHAPKHEDGGVNINNVAELEQGEVYTEDASGNPVRVLEDTSDKREDVKSKTLKVTPEEAKELVNFKPKRSVTHSRLFEEASKYYDKKYKGVEKKIEKNLEYIRLRNGGKYSENSFEENLKMLQQIPTSQQIFDVIYAHQQEAKRKYNVENKDKMKYGGLPKYQNGTKYIDPDGNVIQVGDKIYGVSDVEGDDPILTQYAVESYLRNGIIRPFNNIGNKGKYVDKLNPSVYSLEDKLQLFSSQDTTTGYQPFVPGTDRAGTVSGYNPEHSTWNSYYFNKPITASDFQKNVQVALKPILGYDYDFNSGDKTVDNVYGNVTFNTPLPKAKVVGKKPGVISLQEYIDTTDKSELADKYGITVEQLDNAFSKNNKQYNNQLIITTDDIQPHESSKSQRENIPTIDKKNTSLVPGINDKYSKPEEVIPSTVSSHLGLSGGLGNILGYIDTGRIPVDLEQIDFRPIRARELNPLPTLLENYNDYNAASNMLPHSGAGYANQANLQAQRYRLNNQVMGQYENMNKQRLDAVDAANTQAQMSIDQANMGIRDTFNTRVLTSKEKQRQQKAEYLNGLFKAIDERNAFDRNANLALKLSPFFNEKGEFNHNKYILSAQQNIGGTGNSVQYITDKQTGQKFRIIMDSNGKLISSSKVIGDNKAAEKTPSIK